MRPVTELGIAMLLKAAVEALLYRRLASGIAAVILLVLLSLALLEMCGGVLVYQLYLVLARIGLEPQQALAVISGSLFMLAGLSGMLALKKLKSLQVQLQPLSPVKEKLIRAAHAFIDGMRTPS